MSLLGGPPFTLAVGRLHSSWLGSAEQAELKETQSSFSSEADLARLLGTETQRMFSGSACQDDRLDRTPDLGDAFVVAEEGGEVCGLPVRTLPAGHPASRPFLACPLGSNPRAAGGKWASCPSHLTGEPLSSWEGPLGPASFMFANRELALCSPPLGTHPRNKHSCEGQRPSRRPHKLDGEEAGTGGRDEPLQLPTSWLPVPQGPAAGLCFSLWTVDAQSKFQVCCSDLSV